jgi:thymidine kinase
MKNKRYEIELNWNNKLKNNEYLCDRCNKEAYMECEMNIEGANYHGKRYGVYCKDHYESLFEDLMSDLQEEGNLDDDILED